MREDQRDVRIGLGFGGPDTVSALDFSSFIFDFNRIYVTSVRFARNTEDARKQPDAFGRNSFRLPKQQELVVSKLRFESPGLIEFVPHATAVVGLGIGALTIVWLVLQIIEKASVWPLAKRKLELEIEKLEREKLSENLNSSQLPLFMLHESRTIQSAVRLLEMNPLKPNDVTVRIEPRDQARR